MDSEFLKNEMLEVGYRLKHLREKRGFSSAEKFAVAHDLSKCHYMKMESGRGTLTLKGLLRVLFIYKMSLEDFFCLNIKKAAA